MRFVKPDFYIWINRAVGAISLLAISIYIYGTFVSELTILTDVGLELPIAIVLSVALVYSLGIFQFLKNRYIREASLLSFALFALAVFGLVHFSGGVSSFFIALWIAVVIASGVYGPLVIATSLFITTLYFLVNTDPNTLASIDLINLGASYLGGILSYFIWKYFYKNRNNGKINELHSQLSEEQLKSEMLINSIGDGVIVVDSDGIIQIFNPAAASMTGWNADEAVGLDHHSVMNIMDDEGRNIEKGDNPFNLVMIKKETIVRDDIILTTKSGKKLDLSLIVSPLVNSNESVNGAIAIFRDISKEKSAMKQRAEFISTASHEMRTPVAAIEGYLALALNPKVSTIDEKAKEFIMKAHESTQHLGKLFQDLLSAAKSEDGRLTNHPRVVELGDLLQKITDDARFTAEKKGLQLEYRLGNNQLTGEKVVQPLFYAHIDEERFREVITNLTNNAIKFTEEGRVIVSISGTADKITIGIKDTGVGIPPEDIPHLFQKFYRVDSSATRTIGGTGLGLFISKNIVEQLFQGRIWVESELNQGSTFFIEIPRLSNDQAMQLKQQEESQLNEVSEETPVGAVASPSESTLE